MPYKGMCKLARAQFGPRQRPVDGEVKRKIGQYEDPPSVEDGAHPVDRLDDLGFSYLFKHGLAPRVGVNLHLRDVWPAVAHAPSSSLQDVLANWQERLGIRSSKRAGERLDRLC